MPKVWDIYLNKGSWNKQLSATEFKIQDRWYQDFWHLNHQPRCRWHSTNINSCANAKATKHTLQNHLRAMAAIVGRQSLGLFEKAVVELGNEARPDWCFRLRVIMISQIKLMATSISSLCVDKKASAGIWAQTFWNNPLLSPAPAPEGLHMAFSHDQRLQRRAAGIITIIIIIIFVLEPVVIGNFVLTCHS